MLDRSLAIFFNQPTGDTLQQPPEAMKNLHQTARPISVCSQTRPIGMP